MHLLRSTIAASLLVACTASAAVPLDWTADIDRPSPAPLALLRGESAVLRCSLVRRGRPYDLSAESATIFWQTNGMGQAWWSAPATVASNRIEAAWTPEMDPGSSPVTVFLGARDADGAIYRAYAALRILHAPGADPAYLEPPVQILDFARVTIEHEPWTDIGPAATNYTDRAAAAILDAATNYAASAVSGLVVEEADPFFWTWIATNDFSGGGGIAEEVDPSTTLSNGVVWVRGVAVLTNGWIDTPGAVEWATFSTNTPMSRHGDAPLWVVLNEHEDALSQSYQNILSLQQSLANNYVRTSHWGNVSIIGDLDASSFRVGTGGAIGRSTVALGTQTEASGANSVAAGFRGAAVHDYSVAWQGFDGTNAPEDYLSHGSGTFNVAPVGGMAGFWVGETSLADYAADVVTNYYALSSLGRIYVTTNDYLYVETRDTATNGWETAWSSYAMQTNAAAVSARMDECEQTVQGAVSAWADYDALGHENPDGDVILMNRAYTAIGAGYFWASSGGHYCLCSDGTVAFAAVESGSFRIFGESISNYVGLVNGGSIVVGANANGFTVSGSGENATASIVYSYAGGTHPTIYGASTLAGPWAEMANAVWVDDSAAGTSTATFPATADAFFYKATTTQTIGEYWNATVPSYFQGGVKTSANDVSPVVYDSTVTISSGGHTYRIPAQLVQ